MEFEALLKVGGSLYRHPELRSCATAWANLAGEHRLLLLPGGGPFADGIRQADADFQLSQSAAHWMAILAMDQYAYLLADLIPRARLVRDLATATAVCAAGQLAILAPATLLLQQDPLPHSWQISSDSIAAWLAKYAKIPLLVLLKSIAGIYQTNHQDNVKTLLQRVSRQDLADCSVVDPCFSQTLASTTTCWLIDGSHPKRLGELLRHGYTMGTRVLG